MPPTEQDIREFELPDPALFLAAAKSHLADKPMDQSDEEAYWILDRLMVEVA